MNEFNTIEKYFRPLTQGCVEADSLSNDAAVLDVPEGKQLVVTSDTLVSGTHFFADQSPETIARKALRSNLSDLAAMGAEPYCYQLCLSLPGYDADWLSSFCDALAMDQARYGIFLSGGDTTSTQGPFSISISAFGLVDQGQAVSRCGAQDGDFIVFTGFVGDAYCGLQSLRGQMADVPEACIHAYYVPDPPVAFGVEISRHVHAALDISDGLLQDLGHIAKASGLSAFVRLDDIRFSDALQRVLRSGQVAPEELLSGGDDYQLMMAVPPDRFEALQNMAARHDVSLQKIGVFEKGKAEVRLLNAKGEQIPVTKSGWQHF